MKNNLSREKSYKQATRDVSDFLDKYPNVKRSLELFEISHEQYERATADKYTYKTGSSAHFNRKWSI